jgi:hypothetical protein
MRPRAALVKTIIWRTRVRQTILKNMFLNETPRWAYENYHVENMCSPNHIRKMCRLNEAARFRYKNYYLENMTVPKHIKNDCLSTRHRLHQSRKSCRARVGQ